MYSAPLPTSPLISHLGLAIWLVFPRTPVLYPKTELLACLPQRSWLASQPKQANLLVPSLKGQRADAGQLHQGCWAAKSVGYQPTPGHAGKTGWLIHSPGVLSLSNPSEKASLLGSFALTGQQLNLNQGLISGPTPFISWQSLQMVSSEGFTWSLDEPGIVQETWGQTLSLFCFRTVSS